MARRVAYVHSQELIDFADDLPANEGRASLVHHLCSAYGLLDNGHGDEDTAAMDGQRAQLIRPMEVSRADLCRFHDARYIDAILGRESTSASDSSGSEGDDDNAPAPSFGLSRSSSSAPPPRKRHKPSPTDTLGLTDDCPLFPSLSRYVSLVAGASMTAARILRDGNADIAINWTGGRHHAKRGQASGFCYVNDIVLAIMEMRGKPLAAPPPSPPSSDGSEKASPLSPAKPPKRLSRVLYIDVDLHHGDGPESAFFTTPSCLTLSIHLHAPLFFPSSGSLDSAGPSLSSGKAPPGALHALNVALEPGAGGETLSRVWKSCVEAVKEAYQADAVVLQCGVDGLAGDPCKEWNISLSALGSCVSLALSWDLPTLLLGGGGYNHPNAARAWAYLTSIALERPLLLDSLIPSSLPPEEFALFAPSFSLDVPSFDSMRDKNTEQTLGRVEEAFEGYVAGLSERYGRSKVKRETRGEQL
ncbi:hypothetical protein JCM11251_003112 [Rhodosporidiobolus azoricus]